MRPVSRAGNLAARNLDGPPGSDWRKSSGDAYSKFNVDLAGGFTRSEIEEEVLAVELNRSRASNGIDLIQMAGNVELN